MKLTEREKEILKMLCLPNKMIAKNLNITMSTTKRHVHNIFRKLGYVTPNRCAIILFAVKEHLIRLEEVITE